MAATGDYIISGGSEGKARLNILSAILQDPTRALLEANGLTTGTFFLDAGCGGGNVARMAAAIAGSNGKVTAIDFDSDIIALNRKEAAGIGQPDFLAMSAYEIDYHNIYDIAYSRFLFSHLTAPERVLANMIRSVKPGGRIVVEDVQFSGHFCYPASTAFDQYVRLYIALAQLRGQDPEIGPRIYRLFLAAGLSDINFDVIQPAFSHGEGKWMAYLTLDRIKEQVISEQLSDEPAVRLLLQQLETFTREEHSIISLPRIFRVSGTRS